MPSHFQLQTQDLDFFLVVNRPNDFEDAVSRIVAVVQENLVVLSGGVAPSTSVHMKFSSGEFASDKHVTMSLAVNGRHVADFSRQLAKDVHALRALFPVKSAKAVGSMLGDFAVNTIALDEVNHRLVATVHCLPYLDGGEALPARTNAWRIKKDTPRLCRLLDLEALGRISSEPSDLYLGDVPPPSLFATGFFYVQDSVSKMQAAMPEPLSVPLLEKKPVCTLSVETIAHAEICTVQVQPVRPLTRNVSTSTAQTGDQGAARRHRLAESVKTVVKLRKDFRRLGKSVRDDMQSTWTSLEAFVAKECKTVQTLTV
jgi:hypothetical protein